MYKILGKFRSTEVMYSWTVSLLVRHGNTAIDFEYLYAMLVDARRQLAVFQHHDGITGTAKDAVVADYGERLVTWFPNKIIRIIITEYLINFTGEYFSSSRLQFCTDSARA